MSKNIFMKNIQLLIKKIKQIFLNNAIRYLKKEKVQLFFFIIHN